MTYAGYTDCDHCGAHVRARVNGQPYAHDNPRTGRRCKTTPRRHRPGRQPVGDDPLAVQLGIRMTTAQLAQLDAMCDRLDKSRAQIVRDALDAYDPDGGAR